MNPSGEGHLKLSTEDERLLDELMEQGLDPDRRAQLPPELQARAQRLLTLLGLLEDYPVDEAVDTLVHATMARIDRAEDRRQARMTLAPQDRASLRSSRFRVPVPNFIGVAAAVLIVAAVLVPVLNGWRSQQMALKSMDNLRYVSHAVDSYAEDYGGSIPVAQAGMTDLLHTFTDTINLTPLVELNYCEIKGPGEVTVHRIPPSQWRNTNMVLFLGDRNPIVEAARRGELDGPLGVRLDRGAARRSILSRDGAILWLNQPRSGPELTYWRPWGVLWLQDDIQPPRRDH